MHDPQALGRAVKRIDKEIVRDVIATISNLPKGWTEDGQKPLLDTKYEWKEEELTARAVAALTDASGREEVQQPGRSIE